MIRRNFLSSSATKSLLPLSSSSFLFRKPATTPFFTTPRRFATSSSSNNSEAATSTAPSSTTTSKTTNNFSDEEIKNLVKALEADPELAIRVVSNLSPAARRQLVVAGSAFEWFGGQGAAQSEVTAADYDHDHVISTKDFDTWFEKALQRRAQGENGSGSGDDKKNAASSSNKKEDGKTVDVKTLGFISLAFIGLEAGLPFVGFGFLDNAAMILAGDVIDRTVGMWLGLSVLASAAMGNVVSGMIGMQVHGSIERLVHFFKLPVPVLNEEQRKSRRVFFAGHLGGTIGIATGLSLGMLPLLFLNDKEQASEIRAFHEIDVNNDGRLNVSELRSAIKAAGIEGEVSDEIAHKLVDSYGDAKTKTINAEQFHKMCIDLKAKGPIGLNVKKLSEEV